MKRVEVIDVLEHLTLIYPNRFEADQKMVEAWYFHLKSYDKDAVMANLLDYARHNRYPPTISDLTYQGRSLTDFDYKRIFGSGEE
ncbi:hypothetical protein J7I93_22885 [Bacillus sp. ISL-47]|uniref:replicative helicase loader/inhibitor n=1 Tax=Bacillus sp. ISL-47 TaxID=2819130 RepID=UPI001BE52155|nr:replicative helicase loader/inhibitor [Bacillus sp. ISL-47]MBT2690986.1 hypothetical protein [Bacillus sp. ISL-47]MBT2710405.1 hypothetical protein [Pseudomonas sp. ISL-84]